MNSKVFADQNLKKIYIKDDEGKIIARVYDVGVALYIQEALLGYDKGLVDIGIKAQQIKLNWNE